MENEVLRAVTVTVHRLPRVARARRGEYVEAMIGHVVGYNDGLHPPEPQR